MRLRLPLAWTRGPANQWSGLSHLPCGLRGSAIFIAPPYKTHCISTHDGFDPAARHLARGATGILVMNYGDAVIGRCRSWGVGMHAIMDHCCQHVKDLSSGCIDVGR